ncbi:MAG: FAD-binding protein [Chitinivibrionales bacterium]|nr:FAD-binding protein [Chitinivibrionales bacterium]
MSGKRAQVLIIGGGFAGLSAAQALSGHPLDCMLIDRCSFTQMRPVLPDIAGGSLRKADCSVPLERPASKTGFRFVKGDVSRILFNRNRVVLQDNSEYAYDYLILASGSEPDFFSLDTVREHSFGIAHVDVACRLHEYLFSGGFDSIVVAGGGYTGVETATHIRKRLVRLKKNAVVTIVEPSSSVLKNSPQWIQACASENLRAMGIEVHARARISGYESETVVLSDNSRINNAGLVWAAGMKASLGAQRLECMGNRQGRIAVHNDLRFKENCFAAGDAACIGPADACFRMALPVTVSGGAHAANNIVRMINGKPLVEFRPSDPGFVVPMANGRSYGEVYGVKVRGWGATLLHYLISAYRWYGTKSRIRIMSSPLRACR